MGDDTDKAIRRMESSRQTEMFGPGPPSTPRSHVGEKGFVDPDPDQLVYGAYTLREFLSRTGQDTPLLVRDVIRCIDFSEFEAGYELTGRAPYHPAIMLGLVVYGIMQGQSTLRELETLAVRDLGAHWITGGVFPDHSTLGKFIQRHAALITVDFFEALTREVLEQIGNVSQVWSGDGTVIQSAANRFRTLQLDVARELADEMRTHSESDDDDSSGDDASEGNGSEDAPVPRGTRKTLDLKRLELAVEVGEQRAQRRRKQGANPATTRVCTTDPEAGILKYKNSGRIGPGWVPSILT
ncbi:MAG: transposase, partial [Halobacteriales archaeon]|nr:transposase [Halobacteriales archaeon]